jgi:DNA helicase-2/ATP-dependent DNA helicase PcrA
MTAVSAFSVGDRVFHQKFGYGEVLTVEGDKLDIEFDKAGSKKVVAQYIKSADAVDDLPF